MKRVLLFCAVFPLILAAGFPGEWHAKTQAVSAVTHRSQTVSIYATLSEVNGKFTGTAGTEGVMKPIQNVVVSGVQIRFSVAEKSGTTSFALIEVAGKLEGTVTLPSGEILPVTLTSLR